MSFLNQAAITQQKDFTPILHVDTQSKHTETQTHTHTLQTMSPYTDPELCYPLLAL